ncbi:MAG: DNA repair protein RecN [Anaerolineaceae bacterium]|nr:DNA repair protein RecN [Anaerolineaceae bacterium]
MLSELRIENFAIITRLELRFHKGLVIVTGETGAGKSILLDAIMALVGGKVDATMVRSGTDRAIVEADFHLPSETRQEILEILAREGLDEGGEFVTLGREIRLEGRSIARVNGRSVNVGLLKELGTFLVDIHGQAEHLSLLDVRSHLNLLDRFAGVEAELKEFRGHYHDYQQVNKELNELRNSEQEAARKIELLSFQAQEIEGAQLKEGEEEELDQERSRLANAEALSASAQQALVLLDEGAPDASSISDMFGQVVQLLNSLARIDSSRQALTEQAEGVADQFSDISAELRGYLDEIEFNPRRLEQVENRLELIHQLKRKYGNSIEAVLAYGKIAKDQLENISHAEERIEELDARRKQLLGSLQVSGLALSTKRKSAAETLSRGVETELSDLSMKGAQFSVQFMTAAAEEGILLEDGSIVAFNANGYDQVEFLIAPNPGEGLKPLIKIASGGETSRLMLALKNVLAVADYVPTLIFDEIDQGIGGRVGAVVGEKLWNLSQQHQVMCVTHLPQLAAFGDQHYQVAKQVSEGRTQTVVELLDENGRIVELAQMVGGISESNLNAARELILQARVREKEIQQV